MMIARSNLRTTRLMLQSSVAAMALVSGLAAVTCALAEDFDFRLQPGNLLVSRAVYDNNANNIAIGTQLPPNCVTGCVAATANGSYPNVFNNAIVDGSFGITAKIVLDQLLPSGEVVSSLEVPNNSERGISTTSDQMVSSFSSKSEIALNLSTGGHSVTFMGYFSPIDALDVSNSNTPDVVDPTNPVSETVFRVVADLDEHGKFHFTKTNAYSGINGRAAILNEKQNVVYASGNAGNGSNPQPNGVIIGAGAQILTPAHTPLAQQPDPGLPTPLGSFNITQLGLKADKTGKDTNFRGLSISNNVVYTTKGSGGNGINTVYFIDTTGFNAAGKPLACPNGVGVPGANATLPTAPISYNAANLQTLGVTPYNMCVLSGFPTSLAKATTPAPAFPFGVWFADAKTLYVTDEGNGTATFNPTTNTYTAAAAQTNAGLQKWIFDDTAGAWKLAYVLQAGLNLGVPYTVAKYPTGVNAATGLPFSPATDGLRNITGRLHRDGNVTIWAITSTVSGSGDQGADPNRLVKITDKLAATSLPAGESFTTIDAARFGEVLRGVSFTPGTDVTRFQEADADDRGSCSRGRDGDRHDDDCHGRN